MKRYSKSTLNFYIGREAKLQEREQYEKELTDKYTRAFDSFVELFQRVEPQKESDSGKFWVGNLMNIKEVFGLIDSLSSENMRLRATAQTIHDSYREVVDKYNEVEKKYEELLNIKL